MHQTEKISGLKSVLMLSWRSVFLSVRMPDQQTFVGGSQTHLNQDLTESFIDLLHSMLLSFERMKREKPYYPVENGIALDSSEQLAVMKRLFQEFRVRQILMKLMFFPRRRFPVHCYTYR